MGILKLKRLLKNIAQRRKGGGGGGSTALDRDLRHIAREIPVEVKLDLILQYGDEASKQRALGTTADGKAGDFGIKFRSPQEFAEEVAFWTEGFPAPAAVVPLRLALERGNSRWIGAFRDADGVSGLCGVMEALADSRDLHLEESDSINPQKVPPEEIGAEEEVVKCLMVLFNKEAGLSMSMSTPEGSAYLWPVISRSAIYSSSGVVRLTLLKVLTVVLDTGGNGLKVVLNALDVVRAQKNNDQRFSALVEALSPAATATATAGDAAAAAAPAPASTGGEESPKQQSDNHDEDGDEGNGTSKPGGGSADDDDDDVALPLALAAAVFLNTVLSRAFEFDERVLLRGEMARGGVVQAVARARRRWGEEEEEEEEDDGGGDGGWETDASVSDAGDGERGGQEEEANAAALFHSDDEDDDDGAGGGAGAGGGEKPGAGRGGEEGRGTGRRGLLVPQSTASSLGTATARSSFSSAGSAAVVPPTLSRVPVSGGAADDALRRQLRRDLVVQLDLFDRVADEDARDAQENNNTGDGDGDGDGGAEERDLEDDTGRNADAGGGGGGRGAASARRIGRMGSDRDSDHRDPPAVKQVRELVEAVEGDEAVSAELELLAEKLRSMGGAGGAGCCKPELWRKVRDVAATAAEQGSKPSPNEPAPAATPTPTPTSPSPSPPPSSETAKAVLPPPGSSPTTAPAATVPSSVAGAAIPPPPPLPPGSGAPLPVAVLPGTAAALPPPAAPPLPAAGGAIPLPPPMSPLPNAATPGAIPPPPPMSLLPNAAAPGAIPPPPPMSLLPNAAAGGAIPPPPPMSLLPNAAARGTIPLPPPPIGGGVKRLVPPRPARPARRGVHWKKIGVGIKGIKGTIFEEIEAEEEKVEVPEEFILEGFQAKPKGPKAPKNGSNGGENGGGQNEGEGQPPPQEKKKKKSLSLLDGKEALRVGIVFSTLSVSPKKLCDVVMSMDLSFLSLDALEKLEKLQPKPPVLAILQAYTAEDVSSLSEAEQFLVLATRIPDYNARQSCAKDMQSFKPDLELTLGTITVVREAISEVNSSAKLKRLLKVVLAVGNLLNEGSKSGDAKAITLDSLLKLTTVRRFAKRPLAGGGDDNLAHSIMEWAADAEPSLLSLGDEVPHAAEASTLGLDAIKKEVTDISTRIEVVEKRLEEAKNRQAARAEGDKFVETIEPFLARSKGPLENLKAELKQAQEAYESLAVKFGEDPKKTPSENFFATVKNVVRMVENASQENKKRAEAEAVRIRRQNRANRRKKNREKTKASSRQLSQVDLQSILKGEALKLREVVTGQMKDKYERIVEKREEEGDAFKEMSEADDEQAREHIRGQQLQYQRSHTHLGGVGESGRSQRGGGSGGSHRGGGGGGTTGKQQLGREASLVKQASLVRQNTAFQQARSFAKSRKDLGEGRASGGGGGGGGGGGSSESPEVGGGALSRRFADSRGKKLDTRRADFG